MTDDALVLGAGVMGLTTAVCLAEAGHAVRVWAELLPHESTSSAASGLWVPGFGEREFGWSMVSYAEFTAMAADPKTGVHSERGQAVTDMWSEPQPWFSHIPEIEVCPAEELPEDMTIGWWSTVPLIDMDVYLDYMVERLRRAGTEIERRTVTSLREATDVAPIVVNCTGVGAGKLADDEGVLPIRGQHVVIRNPGIDYWYLEGVDRPEWTGFFPHRDKVLLAGVYQPGNWSLEPDAKDTQGIIERCEAVEPRLRGAEVIGYTVGLRVGRETARVEEESVDGVRLLHNYGQGAFGVSQSWGAARNIQQLLGSAS